MGAAGKNVKKVDCSRAKDFSGNDMTSLSATDRAQFPAEQPPGSLARPGSVCRYRTSAAAQRFPACLDSGSARGNLTAADVGSPRTSSPDRGTALPSSPGADNPDVIVSGTALLCYPLAEIISVTVASVTVCSVYDVGICAM